MTNPFPIPQVHLVTVLKPADGLIGIAFHDSPDTNNQVVISKVSAASPLRETEVKAGLLCLAVDGNPVSTKSQAVAGIKNAASTVVLTVAARSSGAFCRTVVAKSSDRNPGVNFAPARAHCLVQLSRVFPNGPWNGLCREDEIVLAVNGTPVSSREEALQALSSAQESQITTLYLLDATAYRQRVGEELSAADGDIGVTLSFKGQRVSLSVQNYVRCITKVDPETQHFCDPAHYLRVEGHGQKFMKSKEGKHIGSYMTAFNDTVDYQLRALEEVVACQVYSARNGVCHAAHPPVIATFATPVFDEPGDDDNMADDDVSFAQATILYHETVL